MLDITDEIQPLLTRLSLLSERNIRFVVAKAMTGAGKAAQDDLKAAMPRYIDRPNPWTLGSTYVQFAKPADLTVEVGIRTDSTSGRPAAGDYLMPLIKGGPPRMKGADLSATKIAGTRGVLIPAQGGPVRLNQYGNVSLSNYAKVLGAARTRGSNVYVAPVQRGSSTLGIFQRTEGFIRGTSTLEGTTRRLFKIDPNPKRRSPRFPVRTILEQSFSQAFPTLLLTGLEAELARAFR